MGPRGPLKAGYAAITAALADLHRHDAGELIVVPVRGAPWSTSAADTLVFWAGRVGYHRVWLPDGVVELDTLADAGWASVTCPACGARWEDGGPALWARKPGGLPQASPSGSRSTSTDAAWTFRIQ